MLRFIDIQEHYQKNKSNIGYLFNNIYPIYYYLLTYRNTKKRKSYVNFIIQYIFYMLLFIGIQKHYDKTYSDIGTLLYNIYPICYYLLTYRSIIIKYTRHLGTLFNNIYPIQYYLLTYRNMMIKYTSYIETLLYKISYILLLIDIQEHYLKKIRSHRNFIIQYISYMLLFVDIQEYYYK